MRKKYVTKVLLCTICAMVLTGCGNWKNDAESEQIQEVAAEETTEAETEAEKIEVSFEEMNYNAFLKNEAGEEAVGYHIPFGWNVESQGDSYASIRRGEYGNCVSISYIEEATNITVYQNLPESYLGVNDDGSYDEYYDSYDIEYIGDSTCPYGTTYKYKATITDTSDEGASQLTFYDLIVLVQYGNDILHISTSVSEINDADNGSGILDKTIQLLLEKSDAVEELPEGYEYYLESGDVKLLGYHMPEGWKFSEYGNDNSISMNIYREGKGLSLYPLYETDTSGLDSKYIELFENGKEMNTCELGDIKIQYQTELKDEINTSYGNIKIYDQLAHYIHPDGMESDARSEIGMFKWNGQVFWISYEDLNRDAEKEYEGALKELLPQLF